MWDLPVYNTVKEAVSAHSKLNASVTFVPGPQVKDAVVEALEAGIKFIAVPAERVPLHDSLEMMSWARRKNAKVLGPGSLGLISAGRGRSEIGGTADLRREIFKPGDVGLMSRAAAKQAQSHGA